jgi:hypothetical protein
MMREPSVAGVVAVGGHLLDRVGEDSEQRGIAISGDRLGLEGVGPTERPRVIAGEREHRSHIDVGAGVRIRLEHAAGRAVTAQPPQVIAQRKAKPGAPRIPRGHCFDRPRGGPKFPTLALAELE